MINNPLDTYKKRKHNEKKKINHNEVNKSKSTSCNCDHHMIEDIRQKEFFKLVKEYEDCFSKLKVMGFKENIRRVVIHEFDDDETTYNEVINLSIADSRFDSCGSRFDSCGSRFDSCDSRFDSCGSRFDSCGSRFDSCDSRFDSCDSMPTYKILYDDKMCETKFATRRETKEIINKIFSNYFEIYKAFKWNDNQLDRSNGIKKEYKNVDIDNIIILINNGHKISHAFCINGFINLRENTNIAIQEMYVMAMSILYSIFNSDIANLIISYFMCRFCDTI